MNITGYCYHSIKVQTLDNTQSDHIKRFLLKQVFNSFRALSSLRNKLLIPGVPDPISTAIFDEYIKCEQGYQKNMDSTRC